jgi:hypothetical protein
VSCYSKWNGKGGVQSLSYELKIVFVEINQKGYHKKQKNEEIHDTVSFFPCVRHFAHTG